MNLNEDQVNKMAHKGIPVSPGIAIGPAYLYAKVTFEIVKRTIDPLVVKNE